VSRSFAIPFTIVVGVAAISVIGAVLVHRAESSVSHVALASEPKPVTVVVAQQASFRDSRTYIGTLRPWIEANVGPQFVSAYVDTVLVRPGTKVKAREVLATLDCRNASASSQAVAAQARAIDARQKAIADEAARLKSLLDGGFASVNEVQQKEAQSASEEAQLASERARLTATGLEVDDCVLRAPFEGEIARRTMDPGAFARPGASLVQVVDRSTIRETFDVPEDDFEVVAPGAPLTVRLLATGQSIAGTISRRSPAADPDTRTVHVEVDLADPERRIPVNTTGEVRIDVGEPRQATAIPLYAASISGEKASVFVVSEGAAHKLVCHVAGERGGTLYVDGTLVPGTQVVTEGRALLEEGDRVTPKQVPFDATADASARKGPAK
jgi:RND family efflux transporter MFP subunit